MDRVQSPGEHLKLYFWISIIINEYAFCSQSENFQSYPSMFKYVESNVSDRE